MIKNKVGVRPVHCAMPRSISSPALCVDASENETSNGCSSKNAAIVVSDTRKGPSSVTCLSSGVARDIASKAYQSI